MNKVIIGIMIIVVGGLAGWYVFRGGTKVPGMQIGRDAVTPAPSGATSGDVIISDEPTGTGGTKGGIMAEGVITYGDAGFQPKELTVKKGTKVTFRNESAGGMWVASAAHPTHQLLPGFDQFKSVAKGGSYDYTFMSVGSWKYHNHVKPADTATVVVTE